MGDQSEKWTREEVLVRSVGQNVFIFQGSRRKCKYTLSIMRYSFKLNLTIYPISMTRTQNPLGQINMRDARVEEVEHVSDSDSEEREELGQSQAHLTIAIYPAHQGPTYLILPGKQERDNWLYHLTVVSGGGPNAGTQYEQLVQKLMETDGDASESSMFKAFTADTNHFSISHSPFFFHYILRSDCVMWRHPMLLHTKEQIASPLSSLHSESLQSEAIKLFKVRVHPRLTLKIVFFFGRKMLTSFNVITELPTIHVGSSESARHRLPRGAGPKCIATMFGYARIAGRIDMYSGEANQSPH